MRIIKLLSVSIICITFLGCSKETEEKKEQSASNTSIFEKRTEISKETIEKTIRNPSAENIQLLDGKIEEHYEIIKKQKVK